MAMRLTGLMSGMDTESIIQELVSVRKVKVDDTKKIQKKTQWKQDAWKSLNAQVLKLYNGALSNMRFEASYSKKATKVSNPNILSVITGESAMNSVQSMQVSKLAKSSYLTGGKLTSAGEAYKGTTSVSQILQDSGITLDDTGKINLSVNGNTKSIEITEDTTINGFLRELNNSGLNASFDEKNQRIFVSSKTTGADQNFTMVGGDVDGAKILQALGVSNYGAMETAYYDNLISHPEETIEARIADTQEQLLATRTELIDEQKSQLDKLSSYSTYFTEINPTKPLSDEDKVLVKARIESFKDGTAEQKKVYQELKNWVSDYEETAEELKDIEENKLTNAGTDGDGNPIYTISDEYSATIRADVEEEIATAQQIKDMYANGQLQVTAQNRILGEDAAITLNGVEFTSASNTFEINGLTLTVNATTAENETVTITTADDTDGIYDMVKNFIKEYNEIINQMDKLYNADAAKGFEPLTEEEKDSMSEKAVEEWETKIKDSILRKDSTLNTVSGALKEIMMSGVSVNGKKMYLSDFGIETMSYFTAAENEKNAYHIDGDEDDASTSGNADKLKSFIASDSKTAISFFTNLSRSLYGKLSDLMKSTDYSSAYTLYDDKKMKDDYEDYTSKIKDQENSLSDYEDKWYAKFAAMETTMAKLQSNASAVTSLLGN